MSFLLKTRKVDLVLLAEELGEEVSEGMKMIELNNIIVHSTNYEESVAKDLLSGIVAERKIMEERKEREEKDRLDRKEREEKDRLDREERDKKERLELERYKLQLQKEERIEIERLRLGAESRSIDLDSTASFPANPREKTIDEMVRTVRLLTVKIPIKPEGWDYFFCSLEKAFSSEKVPQEKKAKILLCLLGEKAADLLTYLEEDKYDDYEELKNLVLREYQPSPKVCLEKFKNAQRKSGENFAQFATRLTSMWAYYCKLRGAKDLETVNQLVIADRFFETLDVETATHIGIKQEKEWFRPRKLGEECDSFFAAKGKSYADQRNREIKSKSDSLREYEEDWRENSRKEFQRNGRFEGRRKFGCFECGSKNHIKRFCPQLQNNREQPARANAVHEVEQPVIDTEEEEEERAVVAKVELLGKQTIKNKLCKLQTMHVNVNGKRAKALVDSGSEITVVREDLIQDLLSEKNPSIFLKGVFGTPVKCQLVDVPIALNRGICTGMGYQSVRCAVIKSLVQDVLIPPEVLEMLKGGTPTIGESNSVKTGMSGEGQVTKENEVAKQVKELNGFPKESVNTEGKNVMGEIPGLSLAEKFRQDQKKCSYLTEAWKNTENNKANYFWENGFLFHRDKVLGERVGQLVVPMKRREEIQQDRMARYYNLRSSNKIFKPGVQHQAAEALSRFALE